MATDVVYLLGCGSSRGDAELRWSLRSIAKHARNLGRVVVVGEKPGWVDWTRVEHVPFEEKGPSKHHNMAAKVMAVIDEGVVDRGFLLSSDDHVYIADADFDRYPVYFRGDLKSEAEYGDSPVSKYRRSLVDTKRVLEEFGYPSMCFHGHVNTHIEPECADAVREMLAVEPGARYGYEITDLFMNVLATRYDFDAVARPDVKLKAYGSDGGAEALRERLRGYDCFSYGDAALDDGLDALLDRMFPDLCEYERRRP